MHRTLKLVSGLDSVLAPARKHGKEAASPHSTTPPSCPSALRHTCSPGLSLPRSLGVVTLRITPECFPHCFSFFSHEGWRKNRSSVPCNIYDWKEATSGEVWEEKDMTRTRLGESLMSLMSFKASEKNRNPSMWTSRLRDPDWQKWQSGSY